MSNSDIDHHVRRLVGIAALRRLHQMVDADKATEVLKTKWAIRLTIFIATLAALFFIWFALRLQAY